jgi:hypothetical protein
MIRIDPYIGSLLHRWVMGIIIAISCIAPYRSAHGPFTSIDTGLRSLMRAFAGLKPLPIRFNSPSVPILTAPYPRGRLPAAGAKGWSV